MLQLLVSPTIPWLAPIISSIPTPKHSACPPSPYCPQLVSAPCKVAFFHALTYPPSAASRGECPLLGCTLSQSLSLRAPSCRSPLLGRIIFDPMSACLPFPRGASTLSQALPCGGLRTCSPCSAIRPGLQCLGCCNGGFVSPATRPDARSALGNGKCSAPQPAALPLNI